MDGNWFRHWFKPSHPDWVRRESFNPAEAAALGKMASISSGTVRVYMRRHGVSEGLAEVQLRDLLAYAALTGHTYQHRSLPMLRVETARRPCGNYGVLLDLNRIRIISYNAGAMSRTWVAARNIRRNARSA